MAIARQLLRHMGIAEEYVTWVCFIDASTDGLAEAMARNEIDLFPLTTKNEGYIKAYGGLNWGPIIDSGYSAALVRVSWVGGWWGGWVGPAWTASMELRSPHTQPGRRCHAGYSRALRHTCLVSLSCAGDTAGRGHRQLVAA